MSAQTTSLLDAIEHLPAGGTLILNEITWEEYEELLADLGDSGRVRVSYDKGRLEIMSPSLSHERYKDLILWIAHTLADEIGIYMESAGSTTFKKEQFAQGAEPDTCFYVQNAARIIGKRQINLETDPPPDVIVEIDVSHESKGKFAFYAAIGVPEIWRYYERKAQIYNLREQNYTESPNSRAFPVLTADALTEFLEQSKTQGQSASLKSFRNWLKAQPR